MFVQMWGAGFVLGLGDAVVWLFGDGAGGWGGGDSVGAAGAVPGWLGLYQEGTAVPASLLCGLMGAPGTMLGLFRLPGQDGYVS